MITRRPWLLAVVVLPAACASLDTKLTAGKQALQNERWREAITEFDAFVGSGCIGGPPDPRCGQAELGRAKAHRGLGELNRALINLDSPHLAGKNSEPLGLERNQLRKEVRAAILAKQRRDPGQGCGIFSLVSRTASMMRFQSVWVLVDFEALPLPSHKWLDESTLTMNFPAVPLSPGEHRIDVYGRYLGRPPHLNGYKYAVHSSQTISVAPADNTAMTVEIDEGNAWVNWQNGPRVAFKPSAAASPTAGCSKLPPPP